jgi:hypothetical protein
MSFEPCDKEQLMELAETMGKRIAHDIFGSDPDLILFGKPNPDHQRNKEQAAQRLAKAMYRDLTGYEPEERPQPARASSSSDDLHALALKLHHS